ncbi:MAG: hypothetical protein AAGB11_14045 [Pseudomonadota bacterium]
MTDAFSLGYSENEARSTLRTFKLVFAANLILQSTTALAVLVWPALGEMLTGVSLAGQDFATFWAGMVLFASAIQVPLYLRPIRMRTVLLVALLGRFFMAILFILEGLAFWRLAAFDAIFAIILVFLLQRAAIAHLQSRP